MDKKLTLPEIREDILSIFTDKGINVTPKEIDALIDHSIKYGDKFDNRIDYLASYCHPVLTVTVSSIKNRYIISEKAAA